MNLNIFQWQSLKTRVTLLTLAIFLIGIWSLAFYASRMLRYDLEYLMGKQQFSTVSYIAAGVNEELENRLRSLEHISEQISPVIVDNPSALQAILEQRPILQILFNGGITALSANGTAIADVPLSTGRIGINYMDRDHVALVLKEGKASIARPVMGRKLNAPIVSLTAPIRDAKGNVAGALIGVIDLGKPNFLDKIADGHYGKTGDYFLVAGGYRQIIITSNKSRIMEVLPAPGINLMIDRFIQGYEGTVVGINSVGVEMLTSAKGIPLTGWFAAIGLPTEEAFAPIRAMQQRILLTTVFMTLLVGGLTLWILKCLLSPMLTAVDTLAILSDTDQPPQPLPITRQDEIGRMIGGFNHLLEKLMQREVALKKSEEKFRALFESAQDGIFLLSSHGGIVSINAAFARMHGYTGEEMLSIDINELETPENAQLAASRFQRLLAGEPMSFEVEHYCKNGQLIPIEVTENLAMIGDDKYIVGFNRDITKRRRAEEALRKSEEQFRRIVESSPVAMYFYHLEFDERLVLTGANSSADRIIGISHPCLLGKTIEEAFPALAATEIPAIYRKVAKGELGSQSFEIPYKDERFSGYYDVHVFKTGENNIAVYFVDITERKRAETAKEKLEAQSRKLQKSESLGRMAGAIAHHFNNQLQVVMGNLEIAMEDLPLSVNPIENLGSAMHAARKAAEMSGLMLTYLGQTPGKREPLDLSEFCSRCQSIIQAIMPKNVILETDLHSPGPTVIFNANQMQQVIFSLITNSWEAVGQDRSSIHLRVKTVSSPDIPASHRYPLDWKPHYNLYACLEVSDTGCGIADMDIEKVFDPFFTTKFTGRGLGLPVTLGIVRAHDGAITVESEPGRGSVFQVFFPLSVQEVPHQPDKADQSLGIQGNGTVLLIEDEEQVRNMSKIMLTRLGFTVLETNDGIEAVKVFRQHQDKIRCVLSDLTMPRMDGWDTLAALRKLSPGIPVILSSGFDETQVMADEHSEHPNAFLGKPYQLMELSETIRRALANKAEGV